MVEVTFAKKEDCDLFLSIAAIPSRQRPFTFPRSSGGSPIFVTVRDAPMSPLMAKNPNKNPLAERAVHELETELVRQEPLGRVVSPLTFAIATSSLYSRIRSRGLSSREMWAQRDQFSNQQLPLADDHLVALKQPTIPTVSVPKPP